MQRAESEKEFPEIKNYYDEFCPIGKSGYPTHLHAAYTAYFIDKFIAQGFDLMICRAPQYSSFYY
jgi:hypothetical protein